MTRPHGTRAKYNAEHCHCDACRKANTDYERRRIRHAAYRAAGGEPPLFVDAEAAKRHLEALRADGLGRRRIAEVSLVSTTVVGEILAGRRRRIRRETQEKLLRVVAAEPADGTLTDPAPALEAIERLRSRGWPRCKIAGKLGSKAKRPVLNLARAEKVTRRTVRRLATLEELDLRGLVRP